MLFVVLSAGSALHESLVYDEIFYVQEGVRNLRTRVFSDPYNPPLVRELTAIPLVLAPWVLPQSEIAAIRYFPARLVTVGLGILLLGSVYLFTRRRTGGMSALFAVLILAFEPTVLGHSHYVASDIGVALFFFWAYWAWLHFLGKPGRLTSTMFGIAAGLAFASKLSAIPYVFGSSLLTLFLVKKTAGFRWCWVHKNLITVSVAVTLLVVWSTYFFQTNVVIAARDDANRVSAKISQYARENNLSAVESALYLLQHQRVPLGDYLATVKNALLLPPVPPDNRQGSLAASLVYKLPIPLMLLATVGLLAQNSALYAIPVLVVLTVSLFGSAMPWVRYVLPLYPFIAILAAIGIRTLGEIMVIGRIGWSIILSVFLLWYLVGTLGAYPHFISYANELAGPRDRRYEVLTDSNLDWGQSLPDMADFVRREKPGHLSFSYFGRDNGNPYGLVSNREWGSYRFSDICAFHEIALPDAAGERIVAISVSNWYGCGYSKEKQFSKQNIRSVVADSILIF